MGNFSDQVNLELKRAERYSVFVSLVVLDFSFLETRYGPSTASLVNRICDKVRENARIVDVVSQMGQHRVGMLLPETSRQGAEIAGRRIGEMIKDILSEDADLKERPIPVEMASFPDAAGTRTIDQLLTDHAENSRN